MYLLRYHFIKPNKPLLHYSVPPFVIFFVENIFGTQITGHNFMRTFILCKYVSKFLMNKLHISGYGPCHN